MTAMVKEDLVALLKEHLTVSVSVEEHSRPYSNSNSTGIKVSVTLKFENEVIATGDDYYDLHQH